MRKWVEVQFGRSRRQLVLFAVLCFLISNALGAIQFQVTDAAGSRSGLLQTTVRVADFSDVQAFQFTLGWDPALFDFIETGDFAVPGLDAGSFGHFPELGRLTAVWDSAKVAGESLDDGSVLFSLAFRAVGPDGASSPVEFADEPARMLAVKAFAEAAFEATAGALRIGLPPSIAVVGNVLLLEDEPSVLVAVAFADDATPAEELIVTVSSSNEALISTDGIFLSGTGESRELVIEPRPNQFGTAEIGIRAEDPIGGATEVFLTATVQAVNDPPTAVDDVWTLSEDSDLTRIPVLANDTAFPDVEETLSVLSVSEGTAGGDISHDGTAVLYRPLPDFHGEEKFLYVIQDEGELTASGEVCVKVSAANDPPSARDDDAAVLEDSAENEISVLANDDDHPDEGENLAIESVTPGNFGGTASIRGGLVVYTPPPDFFGVEEFRYTIVDGNGGAATATVAVEVRGVNDPPAAFDDEAIVAEDAEETWIDVLANDSATPDLGEALAIESVGAASDGGRVRLVEGRIGYTPLANFFGIEHFRYTVSDGNGGAATAQVAVSVANDWADAPVVRNDRFSFEEDSAGNVLAVLNDNGNGRDFDPDGDDLRIAAADVLGSHGGRIQIDIKGQRLLYTPAVDFSGEETFTYTVSDGGRLSTGLVFVAVANVDDDPPLALNDRFEVREDSVANRLPVLGREGGELDRDPEGAPVFVSGVDSLTSGGGRLSVSEDLQAVIYTPAVDFSGEETFTYIISDGVLPAAGTVTIAVSPVPDAPSIVSVVGEVEINQDAAGVEFQVCAEDVDSPAADLSLTAESSDEHLIAGKGIAIERSEDGWTIGLTPLPGAFGRATLRLEVSDGALTDSVDVGLIVRRVAVVEGTVLGVSGASVFLDANANGMRDDGEPGGETDRGGAFRFRVPLADFDRDGNGELSMQESRIRTIAGVGFATGKPLGFDLQAPLGLSLISPFSTLADLILERGDADALQEVEQRVRAKTGLSEVFGAAESLLAFDPFQAFRRDAARARIVWLRMLSLQSVVQHVSALVSGAANRTPEEVAAVVWRTIAGTELLMLPRCDRMPELLQAVASEFETALPPAVAAFGERVLCDYLARLEQLAENEGAFRDALRQASRLQTASVFGLAPDLARSGAAGSVSASMQYNYSGSRYEARLGDYPTADLLDQEAPGTVRFLRRSFCIGEGGRPYEPVALVREGGHFGPLDVAVFFSRRTASSPDDFTAQPVVIHFADGEVYKEVDVFGRGILKNDSRVEGEEAIQLSLFRGADLPPAAPDEPDSASILKIVDDDFGGIFEFAAASTNVPESASEASVFITRRSGNKGAIRLLMSLGRGTGAFGAEPGVDFETSPVEILFKSGELLRRVPLPILPDAEAEENETIFLRLTIALGQEPNAIVGLQSTSSVSIVDDDVDRAPAIEPVPDQTTDEDHELSVVLKISDDFVSPADLSIEAAAANPALIAVTGLKFDAEASLHRLLLRPQPNAFGETALAVRAGDGRQETTLQFLVTVNPVNDPPTLSEIPNAEAEPDGSLTVAFTVNDVETSPADLRIEARALHPSVPNAVALEVAGEGAERTLSIAFSSEAKSFVRLEVVALDADGGTASRSFDIFVRTRPPETNALQITNADEGFVEIRWEGKGRLGIAGEVGGPYHPIRGSTSPFQMRLQKSESYFKIVP